MAANREGRNWRKALREILIGPERRPAFGRMHLPDRFDDTPLPSPYEPPDSAGFRRMFRQEHLTLGLMCPLDAYSDEAPDMQQQVALARLADAQGFAALWTRDVPLRDPSFGDLGQIYDPWVWLGHLCAHTRDIALATGSIVFPLNHPITLAKAATSVDNLSGGRLFLGIASGDRAVEFPAFGLDITQRADVFRATLAYFQQLLAGRFPHIRSPLGELNRAELVPRPVGNRIPLAITGHCRQDPSWIAAHADAWLMYANGPETQRLLLQTWQEAVLKHGGTDFKPFAQPMGLDLSEKPDEALTRLRSGVRLGRHGLRQLLEQYREIGVNHVAFNLKRSRRPASEVIEELAAEILPHFPSLAAEPDRERPGRPRL